MAQFQPVPWIQLSDDLGAPLVGGKVFTYVSGTTTLKTTYTDAALTVPNTNPIVLNARGEAQMALGAGAYTLLLLRADNTFVKTIDGVSDAAAAASTATAALRSDLLANDQTKASAIVTQPTEFANEQPTNVFSILRGRANVKRFWVSTDGSDWKNAFQKASASGARNIVVPGDVLYNVSDKVDILSDQDWYLDNAQITLTDQTKVLFSSVQQSRWGIRGRGQLLGSLVSAATAVETGLLIDGGKRYTVEGLTATKFKGKGIFLTGTVNSGALRGDRGQFNDCAAYENTMGIQVDASAASEYNTWSNTNISGNISGMVMAAGNNTVVGGSIVDNSIGVRLLAGANHGHGMFSGVSINHNQNANLWATGVINGYSFLGCHMYSNGSNTAPIWFEGCRGITVAGGTIDCWIYNDIGSGSGINRVTGNYFPGDYGVVLTTNNTGIPQLSLSGNHGPQGPSTLNDQAFVYVRASRANSTQSAAGGVPVVFNSKQVDNRIAYDATTGIFTSTLASWYTVTVNLTINGASLSAGYAEIKVGATTIAYVPIVNANSGATLAVASASVDVAMLVGDTVTVTCTAGGTVPVIAPNTSWLTIALRG